MEYFRTLDKTIWPNLTSRPNLEEIKFTPTVHVSYSNLSSYQNFYQSRAEGSELNTPEPKLCAPSALVATTKHDANQLKIISQFLSE